MVSTRQWMRQAFCVVSILWGVPLCGSLSSAAELSDPRDTAEPAEIGRDLFLHMWRPKDRLSRAGDGLGPMFNERSCVACHNQGGVGGGGSRDKNVQILSMVQSGRGTRIDDSAWEQAATVHAGLLERPGGVVLHRFGNELAYQPWRQQRVWAATAVGSPFVFSATVFRPGDQDPVAAEAIRRAISRGRLHTEGKALITDLQAIVDRAHGTAAGRPGVLKLVLTERNPTALFGAGLLDGVSDDILRAEECRQADLAGRNPANQPLGLAAAQAVAGGEMPVVGRVARLADGRIGRFGWKGQNATLADFTRDACAVELGLEVANHHQALDPRHADAAGTTRAAKTDLSDQDCDTLVAYLAALPRPGQTTVPRSKRNAAAGADVFERIGCSDCHRRDLGAVSGVYSDLLLHDMGSTLTGPAYYGIVTGTLATDPSPGAKAAAVQPPSGSEWRTPPLWGCRDSRPYLHDGRAETLAEAIEEHGGQGARSARLYKQLAPREQRQLLDFLSSLAAPQQAERPVAAKPRLLKDQRLPPKRGNHSA